MFAEGRSGSNATFNLIFLGLGWPSVGEFVGLIIIFACFSTQNNLVSRKYPNDHGLDFGDENLAGLGFLWSVSCMESIPTHQKKLRWEKVDRMPLLT